MKGFTLIELLVVVIIVGVLTAVALPQYRKALDRSKAAEAMQMLPALYEARERWMIENECIWSNLSPSCPQGVSMTVKKLDIEVPTDSDLTALTFNTKNFTYYLQGPGPSGGKMRCVSAEPRWGGSRGLTAVKILYRGDKFSCTDDGKGQCDVLNVADSSHRTGCI